MPECGSSGCGPSRSWPYRRGWTRSRPTGTNNSGPSRHTSNERTDHEHGATWSLVGARTGGRTSMSESLPADRSISSTVEVAVDPDTAFSVFTEELDLWWVRGPINHHAAGRVQAMRCE